MLISFLLLIIIFLSWIRFKKIIKNLNKENNNLEVKVHTLEEKNKSVMHSNNLLMNKIHNYESKNTSSESKIYKDLEMKYNQLFSNYTELKSAYASSKIKVHNLESSNNVLSDLADKYKKQISNSDNNLNGLKDNLQSSEDIKTHYKYLSRHFPRIEDYYDNRNWDSPSYTDRYETHTPLKLREILPLIWIGKIKKGRLVKTNFPHYFDSYGFNKDSLIKKYIKFGYIVENDSRYFLTEDGSSLTQQYKELWDMLPSYNDFPINIDKDYPLWNHGMLKQKWIKERIEFLQDTNHHLEEMINLLKNNPNVFAQNKNLSLSIKSMKHAIQENNKIINQLDNGDKKEFIQKTNLDHINSIKERKIELFNSAIKNASTFNEKVIWNTLEDDRVCELCQSLSQKMLNLKNCPDPYVFYDMHPNCRCFLSTKFED